MKKILFYISFALGFFVSIGALSTTAHANEFDIDAKDVREAIHQKSFSIKEANSETSLTSVQINLPEKRDLANSFNSDGSENMSKESLVILSDRSPKELEKHLTQDVEEVLRASENGTNELSNTNSAASLIVKVNYTRYSHSAGWLYGMRSNVTRWIIRPGGSVSNRTLRSFQSGAGTSNMVNLEAKSSPGNLETTKTLNWTATNQRVLKSSISGIAAEVKSSTNYGALNLTVAI